MIYHPDALDQATAQPARAADAASGEQDRCYFESWIRPNRHRDLSLRRG
jgi:hypothetical protein